MTALPGYYDQSYPPSILGPPTTPTLTSLTPNSVVVNTPTSVTVSGTGFRPNSVVVVDADVYPTSYQNKTTLVFTALADTVGTQSVTVTTGALTSTASTLTVTATELAETEAPNGKRRKKAEAVTETPTEPETETEPEPENPEPETEPETPTE